MLKAITQTGHLLYITVGNTEYRDLDLPDGLLTDAELAQVRAVVPGALPMYPAKAEQAEESEIIEGQ